MIPGRCKTGRKLSGERQKGAGTRETKEKSQEKNENCQRCQMVERPQGRAHWIHF